MRIVAYCDGSGTHASNGPACIGVVIARPVTRRERVDGIDVTIDGTEILCEVSTCVGSGTANFAELWAVRYALKYSRLVARDERVDLTVFSDSEYAIGSVTGRLRPRAHVELVTAAARQFAHYPNARILHVPGHTGIFGNELADWLAGRARYEWQRAHGAKVPVQYRRRPECRGRNYVGWSHTPIDVPRAS